MIKINQITFGLIAYWILTFYVVQFLFLNVTHLYRIIINSFKIRLCRLLFLKRDLSKLYARYTIMFTYVIIYILYGIIRDMINEFIDEKRRENPHFWSFDQIAFFFYIDYICNFLYKRYEFIWDVATSRTLDEWFFGLTGGMAYILTVHTVLMALGVVDRPTISLNKCMFYIFLFTLNILGWCLLIICIDIYFEANHFENANITQIGYCVIAIQLQFIFPFLKKEGYLNPIYRWRWIVSMAIPALMIAWCFTTWLTWRGLCGGDWDGLVLGWIGSLGKIIFGVPMPSNKYQWYTGGLFCYWVDIFVLIRLYFYYLKIK